MRDTEALLIYFFALRAEVCCTKNIQSMNPPSPLPSVIVNAVSSSSLDKYYSGALMD